MQAIKNFMLDMLVMMMPVFSPSLIFTMIALAMAGLVVLVVGRDSSVKIGIRFVAWAVLTALALMFVISPVITMVVGSSDAIKDPFVQLVSFPSMGNDGIFKFILQLMPYLLLLITFFVLFFRPGGSALGIGRFLLVMGIIYIMCQIAGVFLGLTASVNFGDFDKYQFINIEFWKLGVGMIIVGSVLAITGRISRDKAITAA